MKITILGCGGAGGVPTIGGHWGDCDPRNPKNERTRSSILVQQDDVTLLVDTSPDLRQQLLRANVKDITAILYTHSHADHTHGFDDIRAINHMVRRAIPIYGDENTLAELRERFAYAFRPLDAEAYYWPKVEPHVVPVPSLPVIPAKVQSHGESMSALTTLDPRLRRDDEGISRQHDGQIQTPFSIGGIAIHAFALDHGFSQTIGYRLNNFAYCTDVVRMDDATFDLLQGVDVWVVDALREEPHPTHSHVEQTLDWIARVKPRRAFLTHMNWLMDYDTLCAKLPAHVRPAYDGLVIDC